MIAARQELDLRPQLERLDRLIYWSEDIDEGALTFAFRPLWQLDEPAKAALALSRAQATQVYAGLKLWPDAVVARLAEAQLVADGTYPNAAAVFAEYSQSQRSKVIETEQYRPNVASPTIQDFYPLERRDPRGRWTAGGSSQTDPNTLLTLASDPEKLKRQLQEGEAGGPGPLDDPALPSGEDPIFKPIPGAASHGPLESAPSPLTAIPMLPRTPAAPSAAVEPPRPPVVPPRAGVTASPSTSNAVPQTSLPSSSNVQSPQLTLQDLVRVTRGFAGRKSAQKWLNQMNDRGWTPEQIEEAIQNGERIAESQRVDPTHGATRYVHPRTGRSVTIDDVTGQVIQLGGDGFDY